MVVQMNIGPKRALAVCCLFNLPCGVGQGLQVFKDSLALSQQVSAPQPGTGHTVPCWKVPAVGAWRQLALGHCTAAP